MRGIILAGGRGTRLYPLTKVISKHMLPVYDKPMIYYPLATLMLAKIKEILIIVTPSDLPLYKALLGDGSQLGIEIVYAVQEKPQGVADAFRIGESFIQKEPVALILGDNFFYGASFNQALREAVTLKEGAMIFGYAVKNPEAYGVVTFDEQKSVLALEEKPLHSPSSYAVPGLYFYDAHVIEMAKNIEPSKSGELDITEVNKAYLAQQTLQLKVLEKGTAWWDMGTYESLFQASQFVQEVQKKEGNAIGGIENIAYQQGWITRDEFLKLAESMAQTTYGKYMRCVIERNQIG